jgi:Ran GTPase-activating protein (RanGAP) involved in mRNA processing and transport
MLSNNRLTSVGAMAMMNKVSDNTSYLDLSGNPEIKIDAYKFLSKYILQDYRKKIQHLILEGNNIGDFGIEVICNTLAGDSAIKYLNVSRNTITDKGAKSLSEMMIDNRSLTALFMNWNEIKGEGASLLANSLKENNNIKVFDLSFNPIGSMHFQKTNCIKNFSNAFATNKTLMHIDFSYCGFTSKDLDKLNSGLKYNHTILGIHMVGNKGGTYFTINHYLFRC